MMHNYSIRVGADWRTGVGSTDASKTKTAGFELVYAGPRYHVPIRCLSMELYNADTGSLLCHSVPIRGKSDELYDEHGLRRAWLLVHPSLPLGRSDCLASSRNNNTLGHK